MARTAENVTRIPPGREIPSNEEAEQSALQIISLHAGLVVDAPALLAEWYARKGKTLPAEIQGVTDLNEVAGRAAGSHGAAAVT